MTASRKLICFALIVLASCLFSGTLRAQFRSEAFSQSYSNDKSATSGKDSVEVIFSFKEYFGGLGHKNDLKIGKLVGGSTVFVGGCQIYNKQYWKLPIVYGTIGAGIGAGIYFNSKGNSTAAALSFAGAGLAWWGSLMDGVIRYKPDDYPNAGKATLYSILLPGLGQIYNKEYWKLPLYLGGLGAAFHYYSDFNRNFQRFRNIYIEATNPDVQYDGPITAEQALYYRNIYRRYRDYSTLIIAAVYLLQVIDANVFSYMHNFEVTDDLSMRMEPVIGLPDYQLAMATPGKFSTGMTFGVRLGIQF